MAENRFTPVVRLWMEHRDSCDHYHGFKEGDEDQCTHRDNTTAAGVGTWCSFAGCPLLRQAADEEGVE